MFFFLDMSAIHAYNTLFYLNNRRALACTKECVYQQRNIVRFTTYTRYTQVRVFYGRKRERARARARRPQSRHLAARTILSFVAA